MSRSFRNTPICYEYSNSWWSRNWHRKSRARCRVVLHDFDPDDVVLPLEREVSDVWDSGKEHRFRFDPREFPYLMRK